MWTALLAALAAAFRAWTQERAIHNDPAIVKNKVAIANQEAKDAIVRAEAILKDPKSTPAQHAEALRQLRIAGS